MIHLVTSLPVLRCSDGRVSPHSHLQHTRIVYGPASIQLAQISMSKYNLLHNPIAGMLVEREEGFIYGDVVEKNANENRPSCGVDGHPSYKRVQKHV